MDFEESKDFFSEICQELNIRLNSKIGLEAIKFCEHRIIEIIKLEIKDRLASLKMDAATRYGRSVLGNIL
jgi:hypothetical protein